MTDTEQLTALFERLLATWTAGDAEAYGTCFTADCDYVSYDGTRAHGRDPMVESHDALFRGVLTGSALVGEIESIRFLGADVALVHGFASVLVAWRATLPRRRLTRTTIVAVRTDDAWRVRSINNSRVRPIGVPGPDAVPSRMARGLVRAATALGIGNARAALT
ncbi:MAG: SgcJ/EcaC family oxidoreductase [Pseudonocardia sp.]|nr:SgcJ/EcaC family oxidoreductase [Pseudonocardia sp.]